MNPGLTTRRLLVLLQFLLFCVPLFAQDKVITGKISDSKTGKPLSGATVKVKNGTQSTLTNEQGLFTLKVPSPEAILTVTYVGYTVYETKAGAGSTLSIALTSSEAQLDDVVVVGYGTKKRSDVLGAISTIKGEVVEDL